MSEERERIAVLEANYRHLSGKIDKMALQLDEMHELMLKARGAKWAIIGMAALGGFLSAKLAAIAGIFGITFPSK